MTASGAAPDFRARSRLSADLASALIALRLSAVLVAALLLQMTIFVEVRVAGVAPELPALVAILASLLVGARSGSLIAFWVGLMWDVYLSTPFGLAAGSFAVVAYALGAVTEDLFHDKRTQTMVLVFAGTAATMTFYALLGEVVGQRGLTDDLPRVVLVASALNALLSLAAAPAMRWATGRGRARDRPRRRRRRGTGARGR